MTNTLTMRQPDDWHCHLRDGKKLARTVPDLAASFARAIVMPNLVPPVINTEQAHAYYDRIVANILHDVSFQPLMTLYLTEQTTPELIDAAKASSIVHAVKLYPAGATTNAHEGVGDIKKCYAVFERMQKNEIPLLIHGEVVDPTIDIFDRESTFISTELEPLIRDFPELKIVLEHISTKHAVDFVKAAGDHVAASITAHHLCLNRNDVLVGGIKPHYYCLPIVKTQEDQLALIGAAISGDPAFFLGTDSAPHTKSHKESACGCAGIYTAPLALSLYASVFESQNALDKLENFASRYGAEFYGLPLNTDSITLVKQDWTMPESLDFGNETLIPYGAGHTFKWQIQS